MKPINMASEFTQKVLWEGVRKATQDSEQAHRLSDFISLMFQFFSKMNALDGLEVEC